jgi:abortive infection bacteriophage resistance protein
VSHPPPVPLIPFSKPWLDYAGQAAQLESRGLVIADRPAVENFLAHVNYYRLSGYCLAFEASRHRFFPGTTFEAVRASYEFDVAIRDLLNEALEVVEVDLRTATAYHFGQAYGAYGHTLATSFFRHFRHADWITRVRDEANRSQELFVLHFQRTYTRFPDLPVWVGTEVMSFGMLSRMLSGLLHSDLAEIVRRYGIKAATLKTWSHHLSYVRNSCAHHARVWNRVWSIKPDLPPMTGWQRPHLSGNDRLACTLLILYRMLLRCPAIGTFAADWKTRVDQLLLNPPTAPTALDKMGLVPPLTANPLWT